MKLHFLKSFVLIVLFQLSLGVTILSGNGMLPFISESNYISKGHCQSDGTNPISASGDSIIKTPINNQTISEYNLIAAADGNVYSTSYSTYEVLKLVKGKWESIQGNIDGMVRDLVIADDGTLYASTFRGLYKRKKNSWEWLGEHNGKIENVSMGNDGNLYARNEGLVMKWGGKSWETVGESGMKAITQTFGPYLKLTIDAGGRIYVIGDFKNEASGNYFVACWTGTNWINIGDMPGKMYNLYAGPDHRVYVLGYADKIQFLRQWDGSNWSDTPKPAGAHEVSELLQDKLRQLYVRIKHPNPDLKVYQFYKLVNNQWEYLLEYPWSENGSMVLPVKSDLMYSMKSGNYISEYKFILHP